MPCIAAYTFTATYGYQQMLRLTQLLCLLLHLLLFLLNSKHEAEGIPTTMFVSKKHDGKNINLIRTIKY